MPIKRPDVIAVRTEINVICTWDNSKSTKKYGCLLYLKKFLLTFLIFLNIFFEAVLSFGGSVRYSHLSGGRG